MKTLLKLVGVVGAGVGLYYANERYNVLEMVRGLITGKNNSYQLSDFYTPFEPRNERVNELITDKKRDALTSDGWKEEVKRYRILSNELADKVNKLNRMPKQQAQFGDGQALRSEIEEIAQELNLMEKNFGTDELRRALEL